MLTGPSSEPPRSRLNIYVLLPIVTLVIGSLYVAGVFYSRWSSARAIEEKARDTQREHDQKVYQMMGGDRFAILNFFAYPGIINRGDSTTLCYSISNAKTATLDPPSNVSMWPAFDRCVSVTPKKTTTFTLTATDAAGNRQTAKAEVEVK